MYTIYMTHPGEALDEIAFYYYGSNEPYLIEQLALLNPFLQLEGGTHVIGGHLAPYQALVLPDNLMTAVDSYQMIMDILNGMPRDDRRLLTDLQDDGLDPNLLLAAAEASYIPPTERTKKRPLLENTADFALGTADAGLGLTEKRLETFQGKLDGLEQRLKVYKKLPVSERYAYFKKFIRPAYEDVLTAHQQRVNFYYPRRMNIPGRSRLRRLAHVEGFSLRNYGDVHLLTQLLPRARLAGHGLVLLDAGLRLKKVKAAYDNHENWERELTVQLGGFLGGYLAGAKVGAIVGDAAADLVVTTAIVSTAEIWVTAIVVVSAASMVAESLSEIGSGWVWDMCHRHSKLTGCPPEMIQASVGSQLASEGLPTNPETVCVHSAGH